jgi:hypothetical protein
MGLIDAAWQRRASSNDENGSCTGDSIFCAARKHAVFLGFYRFSWDGDTAAGLLIGNRYRDPCLSDPDLCKNSHLKRLCGITWIGRFRVRWPISGQVPTLKVRSRRATSGRIAGGGSIDRNSGDVTGLWQGTHDRYPMYENPHFRGFQPS